MVSGSYTVTPSKSLYTFTPASQAVTVSSANVTGVNFSASLATYSISGTIANGASATVTLKGAGSATTTADVNGNYTFAGFANGTYTVTPSENLYTMTPASQSVTINNANATGVNFTAALTTYTISGTVTGGAGATVTLSGTASAATTVSSTGTYSFTGLANGSYTVTPSLSLYTMTPASQSVTINNANATGVNFTAALTTYSISGTVTGGAGATVTLSGAASATTTASSTGAYSFTGLANGSYTVTPTETGYAMTPTSQAVTISNASVANVNFTAAPATYTISGTISPHVETLALAQSGAGGNQTATDTVSFSSPNQAGNLILVCVMWGSANITSISDTLGNTYFAATSLATSPQGNFQQIYYAKNIEGGSNSVTVSFSSATTTGNNVYIYEISGADPTSPLDVTASATGASSTTPNSGSASTHFANELIFGAFLSDGTISTAGTGFTLLSTAGGNVTEYETVSSEGSYSVTSGASSSGWIAQMATFKAASNTGGAGATVTLSGAASATTTASSTGAYSFTGLANGSYTVTPTNAGYTMSPTNQAVTVNKANVTNVNFTAAPTGYSISGTITGGSGSTVTLSGAANATTVASAAGNYTFTGLANGSYTVTPTNAGYTISPANQAVTISSANVSGVNFTATAVGAIGIDANVSTNLTVASTTVSSPVFSTAGSNELILAFIAAGHVSGATTAVQSVSGAGLTWVLVNRTNLEPGTSEIWRAFAKTPISGVSVSAALSQSVTASITVMSFTGVNISSGDGSSAIGATSFNDGAAVAPSEGLVTMGTNSWVLAVGNDPALATARTPNAGQSIVNQNLSPDGNTYWVQMLSSPAGSTGSGVTISDTRQQRITGT